MGRMKNLHAEGVTDLFSYEQGRADREAEIIKLLFDEEDDRLITLLYEYCEYWTGQEWRKQKAIALIKGEPK